MQKIGSQGFKMLWLSNVSYRSYRTTNNGTIVADNIVRWNYLFGPFIIWAIELYSFVQTGEHLETSTEYPQTILMKRLQLKIDHFLINFYGLQRLFGK